jgi:hypothetical protein
MAQRLPAKAAWLAANIAATPVALRHSKRFEIFEYKSLSLAVFL